MRSGATNVLPFPTTSLPFSEAREFPDPPDDEIFLETSQPVHEDGAVEVIHFVLKRARDQAIGLDRALVAVTVKALEDDA